MTKQPATLESARRRYTERAWLEAATMFENIDARTPLGADDLERYAWCAALLGEDELSMSMHERAYHAHLHADAVQRAARSAFWIGFRLTITGDRARGAAWLGRCQRIVDAMDADSVEEGYLLLLPINRHLRAGEFQSACELSERAVTIGERFSDPDLVALSRSLQGRALLRAGRLDQGMSLLDESMLEATGDEVAPIITGLVYCAVISACQQVYDLSRAREWTSVLAAWCEGQPDLVTFRGACQVHRSEILQLGGEWQKSMEQVLLAVGDDSKKSDQDALGDAQYQKGELHRLRGEFAAAEAAYVDANHHGREPQPGLALLRAAQGRGQAALGGLQRLLSETSDGLARVRLLPACIEILLQQHSLEEARSSCDELEEISRSYESEVLSAIVAASRGRLYLAQDDAQAALGPLRRAYFVWHKLGAPYEEARVRVALASACRQLGDSEGAELCLREAREAFVKLGAAHDLAALPPITQSPPNSEGLSARELQVLRLIATGKTNRMVAEELQLSGRTIDRHLSNIFTKIDVSSRAAATAYAYLHKLI